MFWSLLMACTSQPEVPPSKPDIVMVVVDTLRPDHLGVYGHHRPTSPYIDDLATKGTWFHRAYASSGWTLPSMASLLSGLYPHQHLVGRMAFRGSEFGRLDSSVTTVAEALGQAGYTSGAVVNNTFTAPDFGLNQGFSLYDYQGATNAEHRSARETVDKGFTWLDQVAGPGFMFLHFMEPHLDYEASPPHLGHFSVGNPAASEVSLGDLGTLHAGYAGMENRKSAPSAEAQEYIRQRYDEEILNVDDAVRYLVEGLKQRGKWDNTVLIITADHGEEFWDHGGFEHGHTLMGELTRTPIILAGAVPSHGRVDAVVEHIDLVRGLLEVAGAEVPADLMGTDLWAIAAGTATSHDNIAMSENILYGQPKVAVVDATARFEYSFETSGGTLWTVAEDGSERVPLSKAQFQTVGGRLSEAIKARRGSLMTIDGTGGVTISDREMFNQLQSLGYIDGSDADSTTAPVAPSPSESASKH